MRLIDADALQEDFEDTVCIEPIPFAFVKQTIDNAPTVELLLARGSARCEIIIPLTRSVGE